MSYHHCVYFVTNAEKESTVNGHFQENEKNETEIAIRNKAMTFKDEKLLLKVENYESGDSPDFVAQKIQYHHHCKRMHLIKRKKTLAKTNLTEKKCNLSILEFLEPKVMAVQKPILASFLLEHYKS